MMERLKVFAIKFQAVNNGTEETRNVFVRNREDAVKWGSKIEMLFRNTPGAVKVLSVEEVRL